MSSHDLEISNFPFFSNNLQILEFLEITFVDACCRLKYIEIINNNCNYFTFECVLLRGGLQLLKFVSSRTEKLVEQCCVIVADVDKCHSVPNEEKK